MASLMFVSDSGSMTPCRVATPTTIVTLGTEDILGIAKPNGEVLTTAVSDVGAIEAIWDEFNRLGAGEVVWDGAKETPNEHSRGLLL